MSTNSANGVSGNEMVLVTDVHGRLVDPSLEQPPTGSVVLTNGPHGSAWQRHGGDGLWYSYGRSDGAAWEWLLAHRREIILIYRAPKRLRPPRPVPCTCRSYHDRTGLHAIGCALHRPDEDFARDIQRDRDAGADS